VIGKIGIKWILEMAEQVFYRDLINRRSPFQETPAGEKENPAGEKENPAGEKEKRWLCGHAVACPYRMN